MPALPEGGKGKPLSTGAQGEEGEPEPVIHALHSGRREGDHDGKGQYGLADSHAGNAEQEAVAAEGSPVGNEGIDEEPHHYRGD